MPDKTRSVKKRDNLVKYDDRTTKDFYKYGGLKKELTGRKSSVIRSCRNKEIKFMTRKRSIEDLILPGYKNFTGLTWSDCPSYRFSCLRSRPFVL